MYTSIDFQLHLTPLTKQNTFHKHLKPHPYFHIMDGVYPMVHSLPHPLVGEVDGARWNLLLNSAADPAATKPGCKSIKIAAPCPPPGQASKTCSVPEKILAAPTRVAGRPCPSLVWELGTRVGKWSFEEESQGRRPNPVFLFGRPGRCRV